jgi:hypothetical protein
MPKLVSSTSNTLTHDEKCFLEAYRAITSPEAKRLIRIMVETFSASTQARQPKPKLSLVGEDDGGNHA